MSLINPTWDAERPSEQGTLRVVRLAQHAGALVVNLYEIDPGTAVSPLHFRHANEELLRALGTPTLRRGPREESTLAPGEVVAFLPGRSGVHQVLNRASQPARVLIVATNDLPEVAEQVESGQLAIIPSDGSRLQPLGELAAI